MDLLEPKETRVTAVSLERLVPLVKGVSSVLVVLMATRDPMV